MSAKRASIVSRGPSPNLLNQFLQGGAADRLSEALNTPDKLRLATDSGVAIQPETPVESPVAELQERIDEVHNAASAAPTQVHAPEPVQPTPVAPVAPVAANPAPVTAPVQMERVTGEAPAVPAIVPAATIQDEVSLAVPAYAGRLLDGRETHRRLGGKKLENAVDFNLSLDRAQLDRITDLAAYEMLRLRRKMPVSEVVRHLLDFALTHVRDNQVVPTPDGLGLHTQQNGA